MTAPNPTPQNLRASMVAYGTTQITAAKDSSLDGLVEEFSIAQALFESGTLPTKLAGVLTTLFHELNDEDTRDAATRRLTTGAGVAAVDSRGALEILLNDNSIDAGRKHLLERVLDPSHKDAIKVDPTGTPLELNELRKENEKLTGTNGGKPTADEIAAAKTEAIGKVSAPIKVIEEFADPTKWTTVKGRLAGNKPESDDDTVRLDIKRGELSKFQGAVKEAKDVVKTTKPPKAAAA